MAPNIFLLYMSIMQSNATNKSAISTAESNGVKKNSIDIPSVTATITRKIQKIAISIKIIQLLKFFIRLSS